MNSGHKEVNLHDSITHIGGLVVSHLYIEIFQKPETRK